MSMLGGLARAMARESFQNGGTQRPRPRTPASSHPRWCAPGGLSDAGESLPKVECRGVDAAPRRVFNPMGTREQPLNAERAPAARLAAARSFVSRHALVLIVALAAALRFATLGAPSYWLDEYLTF